MSLIPVDAEYHYVDDAEPTDVIKGDVWLDTSNNPPVAKIYADVGNGLEWLQDQTASRVDIPVSDAGASATDITNAVWSDDQQHGPSDLRGGIPWDSLSSFNGTTFTGSSSTIASASGTGYVTFSIVGASANGSEIKFVRDGSTIYNGQFIADSSTTAGEATVPWIKFDSSFSLEAVNNPQAGQVMWVIL